MLTYFTRGLYSGAKISAVAVSLAGDTQMQELVLAHSNAASSAVITQYATVSTGANVGIFTTSLNSTAVAINYRQAAVNTSVKMFIQFIK